MPTLGTWKHTSSILAGLFVRHQHCSHSYVASYAPVATALMTNKNPTQILDDYLFPGALSSETDVILHLLRICTLLYSCYEKVTQQLYYNQAG